MRLYKKLNPNHRKFAERAPVESQRRRLQQDGPAPAPGPPPLNYPLDETLYNGKQSRHVLSMLAADRSMCPLLRGRVQAGAH